MAWLDPESADGWAWARRTFALAAAYHWGYRLFHVPELYSNAGITIESREADLAHWWVFSPATAWTIYGLVWVGILTQFFNRRARLGAWLVFVGSLLLVLEEAINWKAYDRLLIWEALCLALAPTGRQGSPGARYLLTLLYMGLYGLTGWSKILDEPGWWNGTALASQLVHIEFGQQALGRLLVESPHWIVTSMSICAVVFEASFPLLVWSKRVQPWLLGVGTLFHLGTLLLMDVGPFWAVAIAAYPALVHPTVVARGQAWLEGHGAARLVRWVVGA